MKIEIFDLDEIYYSEHIPRIGEKISFKTGLSSGLSYTITDVIWHIEDNGYNNKDWVELLVKI